GRRERRPRRRTTPPARLRAHRRRCAPRRRWTRPTAAPSTEPGPFPLARCAGPPAARSRGSRCRRRRRPACRTSDELEDGHGRAVALTRADLQDPCVTAGPLLVALGDVGEELVGHVAVLD